MSEGESAAQAANVENTAVPTYSANPSTVSAEVHSGSSEVSDSNDIWNLADGVSGTGEIPEWFHKGTFKTVADQARGYSDLQSKYNKALKGFTGAPEGDYEYTPGEGSKYQFDLSSDEYKAFSDMAREQNISQELFNTLLDAHGNISHIENERAGERIDSFINNELNEELMKFGSTNSPEFRQTQKELRQSINQIANMPGITEKGINHLLDSIQTYEGIQTLIDITKQINNVSSLPTNLAPAQSLNKDELRMKLANRGNMTSSELNEFMDMYKKAYPGNYPK